MTSSFNARLVARLCVVSVFALSAVSLTASPKVFVGGKIYASGKFVAAMAVDDGKIISVGSVNKVKRAAGRSATVVDLRGRTVLPGLGDMHVHPLFAGDSLSNCQVPQSSNGEQLLAKLRECVSTKKPGEWVVGDGFVTENLKGTPMTAETLDKVSPNNPVFLMSVTYHDAWVNSKAMAEAGITRDTANPANGMIQRDPQGNPTGLMIEDAKSLVQTKIPAKTTEENLAALAKGLDILLSYGVTMINDAVVLPPGLAAYAQLADRGELKQQTLACLGYNQTLFAFSGPQFEEMVRSRATFARTKLNPNCVKVFMDGTPTAAHTAAMSEPYLYSEGGSPPKGHLQVDPAELSRKVTEWDKMGLLVKFHSAGDQAVHVALDAIEAARNTNGSAGPRHMIAHATFISVSDMVRTRRVDATLEFSPYVWFPQPVIEEVTRGVGSERMARAWPIREAVDARILSVAGSDWPVVPNPNPWIGIETAITRQAPGGSAASMSAKEAITLAEAIDLYTINAARAIGVEKDHGSLEVGKAADFIVLDRNPFAIPVTDIHNITVLHVVTDGIEKFTKDGQSPL
nr:amidohydrolase [Pseudomonas corrugata]